MNKYIIKSLAPWMIDELIAFSKIVDFEIIFLREQDEFYNDDIALLESYGIKIYTKPFALHGLIKKIFFALKFYFKNISKFSFDYNFAIGFKSLVWFLKLDISQFSSNSNIHAQFATQPALIALLIKKYYKNEPSYSFTFHAHDIYFNNRWFKMLVLNCKNAFSISNYNIDYVKEKFLNSEKIVLSRLGVFNTGSQHIQSEKKNLTEFNLGLISWFMEKKGVLYLLKAMLELKNSGNTHIKLILAGDGPLKNKYLDFIKRNDLGNMVRYIGKVKGQQKEDFFNAIDVFVLPSISLENDKDGIPVVLMEAVSFGLPLVSTNVSGIPEICIHDYNGFLVDEKNVEQLVGSIITLSNNKTKMKSFSNSSLVVSKLYNIEENTLNKAKILGWLPN